MTTVIARAMSGNAIPTTLTSDISNTDLIFDVVALQGTWPDTSKGKFAVTLNRGEADEEQVTVTSYTSTQLTIAAGGRGQGNFPAQAHTAGCTVTHTSDPQSMQDVSQHVVDATRNDHTQYPLFTPSTTGHPTTGTWATNQSVIDAVGQMWKCTGGGTPGTWSPVGGQQASWPINSVFIGYTSTSPATLLGFGTWTKIAQGEALVGQKDGDANFGTLGNTPGEVTHVLTNDELPNSGILVESNGSTNQLALGSDGPTLYQEGTPIGAGDAHNNIQPSLTVYVWRRTA